MKPKMSIVVLTLNEAPRIARTLGALAAQEDQRFEVVVVDAASTDGTVETVQALAPDLPYPLRVEASPRLLPIGEARNLGVRLARAPNVAFLSADAVPAIDWTRRAIAGLGTHDLVFGAQDHTPERWTTAASVRGLRYHYPSTTTDDPARYASNVASAYRKEVLLRLPYDEDANAAEDILLARRAVGLGYTATYDPDMRVAHGDVSTWRGEMRKNLREGYGNARYRGEIGGMPDVLLWGAALAALVTLSFRQRLGLALLAGALWAPALRRAWRRRETMPGHAVLRGVAASPAFDVAFLCQYVRGLARHTEETA